MNTILESALAYAALGYPVFPCMPSGKMPITEHGFLDASTNIEQIEAWWAKTPAANIGIATERLCVVDIDGKENPWLSGCPDKLDDLGRVPTCYTPRGGSHRWFRQPPGKTWRSNAGKIAPGIDLRADGGYVIAPPSVVNGVFYRWVPGLDLEKPAAELHCPPQWLEKLIDDSQGQRVREALGDGNLIPSGQRNGTLARIAGTMRRVGMTGPEIAAALITVNADRCVPPMSEAEVKKIAMSVARYEPNGLSVALVEDHYSQMVLRESQKPDPLTDPGDFPEELFEVPGMIGELCEYINRTSYRPQPLLALAASLACMSVLTGRKIKDHRNTRTNLYVMGVAPSGGGKDRAREVVKELLSRSAPASGMLGPENIASHAGLVAAVAKHPAILFQVDEIGRLLRTLGNPDKSPHLFNVATNLMRLFTSSGSSFIGDAYSDPDKNITIQQPHACIYGTTVPESFYEGLTADSIGNGLLSRMLVFQVPGYTDPEGGAPGESLPERCVEMAKAWAEFSPGGGNLSREHPSPVAMPVSGEADEIFTALRVEADKRMRALPYPFSALWTRASEKAAKLAMIHAASRGLGVGVDRRAAEWACTLAEWGTRKIVWLAEQWIGENEFDKGRKRVLREIVAAGENGLTTTALARKIRGMRAKERDEILVALRTTGDIVETIVPSGSRGPVCVVYTSSYHVKSRSEQILPISDTIERQSNSSLIPTVSGL